nr:MAG TPA: hypothetical protein [Caudoviricetes sp.]
MTAQNKKRMELKDFVSFKVHVPSLCHCGGKGRRL